MHDFQFMFMYEYDLSKAQLGQTGTESSAKSQKGVNAEYLTMLCWEPEGCHPSVFPVDFVQQ